MLENMEGAIQLVDNLEDLEESIEACISQKEDICKRQRERQERTLGISLQNQVRVC